MYKRAHVRGELIFSKGQGLLPEGLSALAPRGGALASSGTPLLPIFDSLGPLLIYLTLGEPSPMVASWTSAGMYFQRVWRSHNELWQTACPEGELLICSLLILTSSNTD